MTPAMNARDLGFYEKGTLHSLLQPGGVFLGQCMQLADVVKWLRRFPSAVIRAWGLGIIVGMQVDSQLFVYPVGRVSEPYGNSRRTQFNGGVVGSDFHLEVKFIWHS